MTSHLLAVKRIFRYLKGKSTLGLWYSRDSPFKLVAYTNSDYAGATQDRKSTTKGCQFLGNRLIFWQCKKQTVVATSTPEAKYVAAASCCEQVLWIQNQLLDFRYNFMNTVINIDNNNLLTKGFDAGRFQYLVSSILKEVGTPRYLSLVVPLTKVGDEAVHKELGDKMERAATTASSLEAEQDSGSGPRLKLVLFVLVYAVKLMLMLPVQVSAVEEMGKDSDHPTDSSQIPIIDQLSSSSQPKKRQPSKKIQRQEAEVPQDEAEHEKSVPTPSNDPQPSGELSPLKNRKVWVFLKMHPKGRSIEDIDADVEVTLVNEQQNEDLMFDTGVLDDDEVFVDVTSSEKNEQTTKIDDSTAGEAVTTSSVRR
ncbi:hypothetical protein Tco_0289403 [Tanacetum coccineum]